MCRGVGLIAPPSHPLPTCAVPWNTLSHQLSHSDPNLMPACFLKLKKSQAATLTTVLGRVWGIFPGAPADFLRMFCKMVSIWEMMRKLLASSNCRASFRQFSCNQFRAALVVWPVRMLEVTCVTLILRRVVTGATAGGWNEYLRTWKT